ncbi:MAG TPA: extracellular solute-binding protein [Gemmatimonadaceae bacterium]|jgi:molybdate/tungstate transport system substrate-binding protein|nr:extracellular solute-binding protein [Gemmatimonadaceae bacterium]
MARRTARSTLVFAALALATAGCKREESRSVTDSTAVLSVMNAASITLPVRAVLDSFSARTGVKYSLEPGASLEIARRITELHRKTDVLLLADPEVYPQVLMPEYVRWYGVFARNRIVLAYTIQSRGAAEITPDSWRTVVTRPNVQVGRADPNTDPSGYRTLLAMQLAERHYHEPGLFARLLAAAPGRNVRPREADQVALLQTHELDYIWTYQNLAENDHLQYVNLPDDIDLGNVADSAAYAAATTRVVGKHPGDTLTMRGAPILFAFSIPAQAEQEGLAVRFLEYAMSDEGRRVMRSQHLDILDHVSLIGSGVPGGLKLP